MCQIYDMNGIPRTQVRVPVEMHVFHISSIGLDSLYCGKQRKISKSCCDLDLDRTMPNVELVRAIFICYKIFEFQVPRLIIFFELSCLQTHRQTHADEYSIVAVDKPQL